VSKFSKFSDIFILKSSVKNTRKPSSKESNNNNASSNSSDDDIEVKEVIAKRKKGHKKSISLAEGFTLPSDTEEDSEDDTSDDDSENEFENMYSFMSEFFNIIEDDSKFEKLIVKEARTK